MKKKIPKITKKLKSFLVDESGKITKKDALGLSVVTFLGVNIADAAKTHSSSTHQNGAGQGGGSGHSSFAHGNTLTCGASNHTSAVSGGHGSQIGGNVSVNPNHSSTMTPGSRSGHGSATGHSSHGSHSSHFSSGGGCFTFEQRVLTPNGHKAIGLLNVGDEVISYDENTREYTTSVIQKTIIHDGIHDHYHDYDKYSLLKIYIQKDNGDIITIQSTYNHPFYSLDEKNYKHIGKFEKDESVKMYNGTGKIIGFETLIKGSDLADYIPPVYNLHMQDNHNHNYFVEGVLVHNALQESEPIKKV